MSPTSSIETSSKREAPQSSYQHGKKPLNIIVIGGSSAGLFAGILLKRRGHNVHILESARSDERQGLAAGVGFDGTVKKFFDENDRLKDSPLGVPSEGITMIDRNLNVKMRVPRPMSMTTWDAIYYRLRANFDRFASPYCPEPPALDASEGRGAFKTGRRVVHVEDDGDHVNLTVENVETQTQDFYQADMVIAADGANSSIRKQLQPNLHREEPGYVLWRGTISTGDLPKEFLDKFELKLWFYRVPYSYAVVYTIPGPHGSLLPKEREINWAWYSWSTPTSTQSILTDTTGHTHRTTLPKGLMKPTIWSHQLSLAKQTFHPQIYSALDKITAPFVTVISTIASPRASFFNDKLFLIGDALAQKQPNTAMGVNMAAKNAYDLLEVVEGRMSAAEWEDVSVAEAEVETCRSVAFASWFLNGWFGWLWYAGRLRWVTWRQKVCRRLFGRRIWSLRD